jgi:hypothetical protein
MMKHISAEVVIKQILSQKWKTTVHLRNWWYSERSWNACLFKKKCWQLEYTQQNFLQNKVLKLPHIEISHYDESLSCTPTHRKATDKFIASYILLFLERHSEPMFLRRWLWRFVFIRDVTLWCLVWSGGSNCFLFEGITTSLTFLSWMCSDKILNDASLWKVRDNVSEMNVSLLFVV